MVFFASSIFLSAFLLFQIQPMIGKFLLPWFGGTPAVWSTLMLVFQVLLTGGYAYAYWLVGRARRPAMIHVALLSFAILVLGARGLLGYSPILPTLSPAAVRTGLPIFEIVRVLLLSVDLPFFILASNGTLMQAWFSRSHPNRSYARLYALSNFGSLLGLLTYPVFIEPNFTLQAQGWIWFAGFVLYAALTAGIALQSGRAAPLPQPEASPVKPTERPSRSVLGLWIALSATASLFLLSVTNQVSQEVAVIPFLWIVPLSLYLLSFILAFSGDRGYNRRLYAALFILSAGLTLYVMLNATSLHVYWQILGYCLLLFSACMLCHGELYRLRPAAGHLTTFYLMVSIGGAIGGIFVNLVAPLIFNGYWEFFVGLAMTVAILLTVLRAERSAEQTSIDLAARARFVFTVFALVTVLLAVLDASFSGALFSRRNFYGVIRVRELVPDGASSPAYVMSHGITAHGLQFIDPALRSLPTTYYVPEAGAGLAILNHPRNGEGLRVGMLGVGAGTLAAYGEPGDVYRLYEINPDVIALAEGQGGYFSFIHDSPAQVTMVPGDARLSLQAELDAGQAQGFDVLVLDTFSSDSIPVHLVTEEALGLYIAHLAPDGVIAAHITNLHLDLQPVFWALAKHYNLQMVRVEYAGDAQGGYASHWVLLARDANVLTVPAIQARAVDLSGYASDLRLWTDEYSNLFQILK